MVAINVVRREKKVNCIGNVTIRSLAESQQSPIELRRARLIPAKMRYRDAEALI